MENKRIRSAWEIALERADRLGQISAEELRKQNEVEYLPLGRGLANRYLEGLPFKEVENQISRFEGNPREFVEKGLKESLIDNVDLTENERSLKALKAILQMDKGGQLSDCARLLEQLFDAYTAAKDRSAAVSEKDPMAQAIEILAKRGITGSGIRPNTEGLKNFSPEKVDFDAEYEVRLATLKEQLRKEA